MNVMKTSRVFLYILSILEYTLGGLAWLAFARAALMAGTEIVLCFMYPSREHIEDTAGTAIGAGIIFLIAWWLTRVGRRTWIRASNEL